MARPVKCPMCGISIDRDTEKFVHVTEGTYAGRYLHAECFKDLDYYKSIHAKMRKICGASYNGRKISQQMKTLTNEGKTYKEIYKTLCYWYDVRKEDPSRANGGIGIVSYIFNDAMVYYEKLNEQEERIAVARSSENLEENLNYIEQHRAVTQKRLKVKRPKRLKLFQLD